MQNSYAVCGNHLFMRHQVQNFYADYLVYIVLIAFRTRKTHLNFKYAIKFV